jgi:predicted nucleotidyltransferase
VFGSYARGDFGRKSDLGLLVLLRRLAPDERWVAHRLHGTENRLGIIRPLVLDLARGVAFIQAEQVLPVRDALDEVGAVYDVIPVWREV